MPAEKLLEACRAATPTKTRHLFTGVSGQAKEFMAQAGNTPAAIAPGYFLFSIGLSDREKIVGIAIVGHPVARHLDDRWTLEVNRLCMDGTRNACSMLYAAAWRAAPGGCRPPEAAFFLSAAFCVASGKARGYVVT